MQSEIHVMEKSNYLKPVNHSQKLKFSVLFAFKIYLECHILVSSTMFDIQKKICFVSAIMNILFTIQVCVWLLFMLDDQET